MESSSLQLAATTSSNVDLKTIAIETQNGDKHTKDILDRILRSLKIDSPSWSWDIKTAKSTCPNEVVFSEENNTVIFHPSYSFGTAAVFGDKPIESNLISYWEVQVPRFYGTSMMLGLGTRKAKTHSATRFEHLLRSKYSCGLAHNGYLYRGENRSELPTQFCAPFTQDKQVVVGMMFHGPQKWLAYFLDGQPLGVAFRGLDMGGEKLYPMVSSTAQKSQFTLGRQCSSQWPLYSLSSICLKKVCECIGEDTSKIAKLKIPEVLEKALHRHICSTHDYLFNNNRKKKKGKKKAGPTTSSSTARKRKGGGGVVHSTIIQQFDDELEMGGRLSRLVVSDQCQLFQSILNGSSVEGVESLEQRILKRTRV